MRCRTKPTVVPFDGRPCGTAVPCRAVPCRAVVAEGKGFEPLRTVKPYSRSRRAHSSALATLSATTDVVVVNGHLTVDLDRSIAHVRSTVLCDRCYRDERVARLR